MTPEEVMALPEAAAMEAEEAQTQGAVAATIEEEELESLSSEIP